MGATRLMVFHTWITLQNRILNRGVPFSYARAMGYGALLGRVAMALAVTLFAGSAEAAAARTYVANCGNPSYLEFKPDRWSSSCAGGV